MDLIQLTTLKRVCHHHFQKENVFWEKLQMLFYGQFISFLLSASGATNDVLVHSCNFYAPTFQMACVYAMLALLFYILPKCRHLPNTKFFTTSSDTIVNVTGEEIQEDEEEDDDHPNDLPRSSTNRYTTTTILYYYYLRIFIVALCDVEANYLAYLSYQYTSFTSVTLLMSLSIPSTMISSVVLLKRHYTKYHYLGASICFIGSSLTVLSDTNKTEDASTSSDSSLVGDVLAIFGAILYGLVDTLMEWAVKLTTTTTTTAATIGKAINTTPIMEDSYGSSFNSFLCKFGFIGAVISLLQVLILERKQVSVYFHSIHSNAESLHPDNILSCSASMLWGITSLFVLVTSFSYISSTRFLLHYEAAVFNLSLLTSNGWAVLFALLYGEERQPGFFFFVSLLVIVIGVIVYEIAPSPPADQDFGDMAKIIWKEEEENKEISNDNHSRSSSSSSSHSNGEESAPRGIYPVLLLKNFWNEADLEFRSNEGKGLDTNPNDVISRRSGYDLI